MKQNLIILIAILIAMVVCYNFYQDQQIESWANSRRNSKLSSALLLERSNHPIQGSGQQECLCQCQFKCPPKKTLSPSTKKQSTSSKKDGYRINHYPWYIHPI